MRYISVISAIAVIAAMVMPIGSQTPAQLKPTFEAASIRPNHTGKGAGNLARSPIMLTIRSMPLINIIGAAYGIAEYQIAGPSWLKEERFDIVAKAAEPVVGDEETLPLLQPLLAERFGLALHRETRQLRAYVLTVAKGGPKMEAAAAGADALPFKKVTKTEGARINAPRLTMTELAEMLSRRMGQPVRDMTALVGEYRVELEWAADDKVQKPDKGKPAKDLSSARDRPTIFTALQEQLGLKLETRKTTVEMFVIDHVERTPNRELIQ